MSYQIFQYVPMSKSNVLSRVIPKILNAKAKPILDLEDSVQDTLHPENTPFLKKDARDSIPSLVAAVSQRIGAEWPLYMRINSMDTEYFADDLLMLRQLAKDGHKFGIIFPKAAGIQNVEEFANKLEFDPGIIRLNPLIETVDGMKKLDSLLTTKSPIALEYIHYGHYDYSLDSKCWPFWEQDSKEFWVFVEDMIKRVEASGHRYVHTPFGRLHDGNMFKNILKKLSGICKRDFGIPALNFDQVIFGSTLEDASGDLEYVALHPDGIAFAQSIVDEFEGHLRSKRSFSMNLDTGEFITPHHYRMARAFLADRKS